MRRRKEGEREGEGRRGRGDIKEEGRKGRGEEERGITNTTADDSIRSLTLSSISVMFIT